MPGTYLYLGDGGLANYIRIDPSGYILFNGIAAINGTLPFNGALPGRITIPGNNLTLETTVAGDIVLVPFRDVDFTDHEAAQLRLKNHTGDPGGLHAGNIARIWYNATTKRFRCWDGTSLTDLPGDTVDTISVTCDRNTAAAVAADFAFVGVWDYVTNNDNWFSAGVATCIGTLKGYGPQTWIARVMGDATTTLQWGVDGGGNNYAYIVDGAGNTVTFATDNGSGVAEQTLDIALTNYTVVHTYKIHVDAGVTRLYIDNVLRATHIVKPTPQNIILYSRANNSGIGVMTWYRIRHVKGRCE